MNPGDKSYLFRIPVLACDLREHPIASLHVEVRVEAENVEAARRRLQACLQCAVDAAAAVLMEL